MPEIHPSHDVWEEYEPDAPFWMCSSCGDCACCSGLERPCNPQYKFEEF